MFAEPPSSVAVDLNDLPANKEAKSFRAVAYTNQYFTHTYQVHCETLSKEQAIVKMHLEVH